MNLSKPEPLYSGNRTIISLQKIFNNRIYPASPDKIADFNNLNSWLDHLKSPYFVKAFQIFGKSAKVDNENVNEYNMFTLLI